MTAPESAQHYAAPHTEVPAPPPGPGVVPPFAAPPRDRDRKSLWIGLGVGGLLLVLCCVGGVLGIGVLASGSEDILRSEATSVVDTYLGALRRENYREAYDQLCSDVTSNLSYQGFQRRVSDPALINYRIDSLVIDRAIAVNATIQRDGLAPEAVTYPLVQAGGTLKICGGV